MTSPRRGPKFLCTFRPALYEQIASYADAAGMSDQDAVRELVEVGLSMAPRDTVVQAARQRAYDDSRRFVMSLFMGKVREVSRECEVQLGLNIWTEDRK